MWTRLLLPGLAVDGSLSLMTGLSAMVLMRLSIRFFGMWRVRFLCATNEIIQVGPDIGPSADAQPSLQCLLGLLPKWQCLAQS